MEFSEHSQVAFDGRSEEISGKLNSLEQVLTSQQWHDLVPNFPSPEALCPKEMTELQIKEIATIFASKDILDIDPGMRKDVIAKRIELNDGGTLEYVGGGESKVCYVLTTPDRKKMAVLLRGYNKSLGVSVPSDPKLAKFGEDMKYELYEYSDLRTYLSYPVSSGAAIVLQEYGGSNNSKEDVNYRTVPVTQAIAKERAKKYMEKRGFKFDIAELRHARHYLYNRGGKHLPAVIDIPATKVKDLR